MNCCKHTNKNKKCKRNDGKIFTLPRKFTRKICLSKKNKGFTMRSSCAPYKMCKKKEFLFNPNNPKKSFDVYIDKNPNDTINIKYKTLNDIKNTIDKLEYLYKTKKYSHKRIWQVGMIMKVRLGVILKYKNTLYKNAKNIKSRFDLANKYFKFLGKRTKNKEKNLKFNY
tara:strand:- start:55 stop:561 length:507 start_codon:yes stop_codon:yes gene_type:complete